jgi:hypothetical protein
LKSRLDMLVGEAIRNQTAEDGEQPAHER